MDVSDKVSEQTNAVCLGFVYNRPHHNLRQKADGENASFACFETNGLGSYLCVYTYMQAYSVVCFVYMRAAGILYVSVNDVRMFMSTISE